MAWAALVAVSDGRIVVAFWLLGVALVVDATDGVLARAARVRERVPEYDGARLDDIVDYQTYVSVPMFLLWKSGLLGGALGGIAAAAALLASAYRFCHADAKTDDHYFTGFPSYWNIVAFYLYVFGTAAWLNALLILGFAAAVFAPLRFIYPSRTVPLRSWSVGLGVLWGCSLLFVLASLPVVETRVALWSLLYPVYYAAVSFWLQLRRLED